MEHLVVGMFDRFIQAEDAIDALAKAGFGRNDLSLVAGDLPRAHEKRSGEQAAGLMSGAGTGAAIGGTAGLLLGLSALAIPGIGPVVAVGPIAAALSTAGIGAAAGGFLGALAGVPEEDKQYYAEAIQRGGAMVIVHAEESRAAEAARVLQQAGAVLERPVESPESVEQAEQARSSQPAAPQMVESGARIYAGGLEMNPRKSRFEDFSNPKA